MEESNATQSPIPWYRTRWFWGIIIGVLIAWGLFFYFFELRHLGGSLGLIFREISASLGASFFMWIGALILEGSGRMGSILVYYIFAFIFLYKTFYKIRVKILYPLIFTINFVISSMLFYLVLSGL